MLKRTRALMAVFLGLSVFLAMVPFVEADTQGSDCVGDTTVVRLWENPIGDTSDGNDSVWLCNDVSNLANIPHLPPGNCHSPFFGSTSWNECVDSYTLRTPTGFWICFYRDANYVSFQDSRQAWNQRFDILFSDQLSSYLFQVGPNC